MPEEERLNDAQRLGRWARKFAENSGWTAGSTDGDQSAGGSHRREAPSPAASAASAAGEKAKRFFNDWKAATTAGREKPRPAQAPGGGSRGQKAPGVGDVRHMLSMWDPWPWLVESMADTHQLHKLVIGTDGNNLAMTEPRRNVLILGPPRSEKTAGVLTLTILGHPGPVVSTSTKGDVLRATGLVRARLGRVWHYSPDGSPTPPGCTELRWSPIPASKRWSSAIALGKAMADIAETGAGTSENASYFRTKAGVVIAALLHAAGLDDKPMMWLMRAVNGDRRVLAEAAEILEGSLSDDSQIAAGDLQGVLDLDERSRGAIFATTANAFAAYRLPGALASVKDPNFDPAAFVAGDPKGYNPLRVSLLDEDATEMDKLGRQLSQKGRFDTVYITASSEQQNLVAPIVAGFLSQIREATFAQHRKDEADDYFTRPAVLWALDEIAGIAPMRDLPETLSQSGGQGLLVAVCLQDLSLARAKWDKAADAFLTLFGNVVVHAGIRDEATLRALSTVIGKQWVDVVTEGTTQSSGSGRGGWNNQQGWQSGVTQQYVDRLDPGAIARGRVGEHPHYVLGLTPKDWGWFFCMPYYSAPPWPQLLITNLEYAVRVGNIAERFWSLATPILDRDGTGQFILAAANQDLLDRYKEAVRELKDRARKREEFENLGPDALLAGYDDSWVARLPAPQRCFIALKGTGITGETFQIPGGGPSREQIAAVLEALPRVRAATAEDEFIVNIDDTLITGKMRPFGDLADSAFFTPEWVVGYAGHTVGLAMVPGGPAERASTTAMSRFGAQIPGTGALIEAWSWSRPGLHIARRLAEHLSALTPACYLDAEGFAFFGPWHETPGAGS